VTPSIVTEVSATLVLRISLGRATWPNGQVLLGGGELAVERQDQHASVGGEAGAGGVAWLDLAGAGEEDQEIAVEAGEYAVVEGAEDL
jgi:hypothetical protein